MKNAIVASTWLTTLSVLASAAGVDAEAPSYMAPESIELGMRVTRLVEADLVGDGTKEIVAIGVRDEGEPRHRVMALGATATGTLAPIWHFDLTAPLTDVDVSDYDDDGVADIIVSTKKPAPSAPPALAEHVGLLVFVNAAPGDDDFNSRKPLEFSAPATPLFEAPRQAIAGGILEIEAPPLGDRWDVVYVQESATGVTPADIPEQFVALHGGMFDAARIGHGDFDGDGDQDLLLTQRVHWNTPQGFIAGPMINFDVIGFEGGAVDLTGDGRADLLARTEADTVTIFASDGSGGFIAGADVFPVDPSMWRAAQVDQDAQPDILFRANGVSILYGTMDGALAPPRSFDAAIPFPSFAVIHLPGDPYADVVTPTPSGVEIARGRPNRRFTAPTTAPGVFQSSGLSGLGDLDEDGLPDLVAPMVLTTNVVIYLNTHGAFQFDRLLDTGVLSGDSQPVGAAVADVNDDDVADVLLELVNSAETNHASISLARFVNSDGTFALLDELVFDDAQAKSNLTLRDLTGDGADDVGLLQLRPLGDAPQGVIVLPDEANLKEPPIFSPTSIEPAVLRHIHHVQDLNDDGLPDMVAGTHLHSMVSNFILFHGLDDGAFDGGVAFEPAVHHPIAFFDVNADGVLDLVGGRHQASPALTETGLSLAELSVQYGDGKDGFSDPTPFTKLDGVSQLTRAVNIDVTGDSDLELVVSGATLDPVGPSIIGIFMASPELDTAPSVVLRQSSAAYEFRTIDFEGDGDLDLAVAGYDRITIHESTHIDHAADIDRDGFVNAADLTLLLNAWGSALRPHDINEDGEVNGVDLGLLLSQWSS